MYVTSFTPIMWRACSSGIFIVPGRGKHTDQGGIHGRRAPSRGHADRSIVSSHWVVLLS